MWKVMPDTVARPVPERWQVPEWMVARTLDLSK